MLDRALLRSRCPATLQVAADGIPQSMIFDSTVAGTRCFR